MLLVYKQKNLEQKAIGGVWRSGQDGWYLFGFIPIIIRHFVNPF